MKLNRLRLNKSVVFVLLIATSLVLFGASTCDAQWGFGGRGNSSSRGGLRYRGPIFSFEIASPYPDPFAGAALPISPYPSGYPSAFDSNRFGIGMGATTFDRYRGMQPTQAELDRERFYYDLDRTHRYQTREQRYGDDFAARYTSPSAMVDRYRYPYVAGTAVVPAVPRPVPGVDLGRYQSRYQGYVADDDVAVALRAAAVRLQLSLARKADGHLWIRHLKPDQIIDSIDRLEFPGTLAELLVNYEGVAENPRLILIAASEGFSDIRRLLPQYVTLSSPYPNASQPEYNEWQSSSPTAGETILSERIIGEQVIEPQTDSQGPTLAPPLPIEPVGREDLEQLSRPNLEDLPGDADMELLPAPAGAKAE